MHPLTTNPAVASVARAVFDEVKPTLHKALDPRLHKALSATPKALGVGVCAALVTCFAAGIGVGWLTAPRAGAQMRASLRDGVRAWTRWGANVALGEDTAPESRTTLDGELVDLTPKRARSGDGGVEVSTPH